MKLFRATLMLAGVAGSLLAVAPDAGPAHAQEPKAQPPKGKGPKTKTLDEVTENGIGIGGEKEIG